MDTTRDASSSSERTGAGRPAVGHPLRSGAPAGRAAHHGPPGRPRPPARAPGRPAAPDRPTRRILVAALYWLAMAGLAFGVILSGADLALADHHPVPESTLLGFVPRPVFLLAYATLALVMTALAAFMRHARAVASDGDLDRARTGRRGVVAAAWSLPAVAAVTVLDAQLLAFAGYLPLTLVLAPFDVRVRESLGQIVEPANLVQVLTVVGVVLWAAAVLAYQRATAAPGVTPRWMTPESAARWGRAAGIVAALVPAVYAGTRFSWMFYPLGFPRDEWEEGMASGALAPGLWLGTFALVGALLTIGLNRPWGEVFPRWMPGIGGRRVPIGVAVVPASVVSVLVVPAGISMILMSVASGLFDPATFAESWAATGPALLWPLWGVALGAATLGYYLRRRVEEPTERTGD